MIMIHLGRHMDWMGQFRSVGQRDANNCRSQARFPNCINSLLHCMVGEVTIICFGILSHIFIDNSYTVLTLLCSLLCAPSMMAATRSRELKCWRNGQRSRTIQFRGPFTLLCSVLRLAMIMTHLGRHLDWMGPSSSCGRVDGQTDANCRATGKHAFPTAIIHRFTAWLAKYARHHATDIIAIYTVEVFYLNEHFRILSLSAKATWLSCLP